MEIELKEKNDQSIFKREVDNIVSIFVIQIVVFISLVLMATRDFSGSSFAFGVLIIFIIPNLIALIGIVFSIDQIFRKKKKIIFSMIVLIISLAYSSGFLANTAVSISRTLTGENQREKEALELRKKELEKFNERNEKYIIIGRNIDIITREFYRQYEEYVSSPRVFVSYEGGSLVEESNNGIFLFGTNLEILNCPKCYIDNSSGEKKYVGNIEKAKRYERQKEILDELLGVPLNLTLPSYEEFKKTYSTQIRFFLRLHNFFTSDPNDPGYATQNPDQSIDYYLGKIKDFGGRVPVIIYLDGRNINQEIIDIDKDI